MATTRKARSTKARPSRSTKATKARPSRSTKKDLEARIQTLEAQIEKLTRKQAGTAPPPPKQAEAPPQPSSARGSLPKGMEQQQAKPAPPPKQAEAPPQPSSARGSLPKGMEQQQAKPAPPPKQAEAPPQPATVAEALEESYRNFPIKDTFAETKATIAGYTPGPSRYFARNTAPTGKVPTSDWNLQKATVTGYTQPSNQYFATRQRLAYHPPEKRFTAYGMQVEGAATQASAPPPPPPPPPPQASSARGSLPKGMERPQQAPPQKQGNAKTDLEEYEKDYLKRIEQQQAERAELEKISRQNAKKEYADSVQSSTHGTLPKGF